MARLPDNFFDDDDTTPEPIKVPKGWAVETEDEADIETANETHAAKIDIGDEDEDILPESPVVDYSAEDDAADTSEPEVTKTYDDGTTAAPLPAPKRRPLYIEDDFGDEAPAAPVAKPKKRHAWIEDDFEDDEPVLKARLTVGPKGEPVVDLDEAPAPMKVRVTEVDADDEPIGEPYMAKPGQRIGRGATPAPEPVQPDEVPEPAPQPDEPYIAPVQQEKIVPVKRLSEKALLVSLNISQWNGRRFDRQVSAEVNASKAAVADAGRFNKVLLPDCKELAEVHRQTSSLRNWFVEKTLPWMNDGARITPSSSYLAFTSEFRARQATWTTAVEALVAAYPALKARAPQQLKSMYNAEDYPTALELRRKFGMSIRSFPLPDKEDFRVELDTATLAALKDSMADVEGDLARQVVGECYTRLGKAVGAMAERLSQPDAIFRDSLTENLAEAVMALKDLNITGDPKLEALRRSVEQSLVGYTADELRNDMSARKAAADTAKAVVNDITHRMAGLMGTPQ